MAYKTVNPLIRPYYFNYFIIILIISVYILIILLKIYKEMRKLIPHSYRLKSGNR